MGREGGMETSTIVSQAAGSKSPGLGLRLELRVEREAMATY